MCFGLRRQGQQSISQKSGGAARPNMASVHNLRSLRRLLLFMHHKQALLRNAQSALDLRSSHPAGPGKMVYESSGENDDAQANATRSLSDSAADAHRPIDLAQGDRG
jgi:hypothetical protein